MKNDEFLERMLVSAIKELLGKYTTANAIYITDKKTGKSSVFIHHDNGHLDMWDADDMILEEEVKHGDILQFKEGKHL
jgi:hypothetical protein